MIKERYQECLSKFLEPNLCFVVFNYKKEVAVIADCTCLPAGRDSRLQIENPLVKEVIQ
jgi:hypothetical protein